MANFSRKDIKQFFQDTTRERLNGNTLKESYGFDGALTGMRKPAVQAVIVKFAKDLFTWNRYGEKDFENMKMGIFDYGQKEIYPDWSRDDFQEVLDAMARIKPKINEYTEDRYGQMTWTKAKSDFKNIALGDPIPPGIAQYYPGWKKGDFEAVLLGVPAKLKQDLGAAGSLYEATKLSSRWGTELYGGRGNAMGVSDADLEHAHNDEMGLRFFHPKNDRYGLDDSEDALDKGEVDFYSSDEMERALNHFDHEDDGNEMDMPNLFDDDLVMERKKIRQMIIQLLKERV